jgi:CHASE3 domain sensor protein
MFKKVFGLLRNPDDVTPEQAVAFQQEAEQVAQTMEKEEDEIMARFLAQQNALAARYGFVIESTPESR